MKLKTLNSSKQYEWHKHFLWIPKRVRINNDRDKTDRYTLIEWKYEYSILWLETVDRKCLWNISLDTDDTKYIYWKHL